MRRLRRRRRDAGDGDRCVATARPVLRELHDRLGQRDRAAGVALGRLLARRPARRPVPTPRALGLVVAAAACLVAFATLVARPILDLSVEGLDRVSAGAIGSFFGVLVLFVPPVTLMGMVAPFAIRLAIRDIESAGTVSGRLYAVSTIGSLLGTFLAALVAIPAIGTQRTLLAAALIGASGAVLLGRRWLLLTAGLVALLLIPPGAVKGQSGGSSRTSRATSSSRSWRRTASGGSTSTRGLRRTPSGGGRRRADRRASGTRTSPSSTCSVGPEQVAMLGNAAGTAARAYERFYPGAEVDGVELDPAVAHAGRRYFGMGEIRTLSVHDADARAFLRQTDQTYDVIIVDAYRPPYVPFYLATKEFFELVRERLRREGSSP